MLADHSVYLREGFSAHDLSAAILAGESYSVGPAQAGPSSVATKAVSTVAAKTSSVERESKVDISVALQRLNFGIEEVTRQLRQEVRSSLYSPIQALSIKG
jgi:hypothetical protein